MKTLKIGMNGVEVLQWQKLITKAGFPCGSLDGIFGSRVELATKSWQKSVGLTADGIVGEKSWSKFNLEAKPVVEYYPPMPDFKSPTQAQVKKMFGEFEWKEKGSSEITILGGWQKKNIVKVIIPQLIGVPFAPKDGGIFVHRLIEKQLVSAFQEIEDLGLKDRIISWSGAFYPRKVRGSATALSNHSWGTAIDINAPENWLGQEPAKLGKKGCLLELVPIFNKWGFFWGGAYSRRLDCMHFECAKLL